MNNPAADIQSQLQKPGAGIPLHNYLLTRFIVGPLVAKNANWDDDSAKFHVISQKIFAALDGLTAEQLEKRVLVPPQFGLEDSSRYWSAAMTLRHLMIVGEGIKRLTVMLSQGIVPEYKVDTAAVKPEITSADVLPEFRAFCDNAISDIESRIGDKNSATVLPHPWFGPFTARQWHWLLATHHGIHYKQIRNIVKGL